MKLGKVISRLTNKGCIAVRLNILDSSFCFLNPHFDTGSKIENFEEIHNSAF